MARFALSLGPMLTLFLGMAACGGDDGHATDVQADGSDASDLGDARMIADDSSRDAVADTSADGGTDSAQDAVADGDAADAADDGADGAEVADEGVGDADGGGDIGGDILDDASDAGEDSTEDALSEPDAAPEPPSVVVVSIPSDPDSDAVDVEITVAQPASLATGLTVSVTFDGGGHWWPASVTPNPVGLATSPAGVAHTLSWEWTADVGMHRPFAAELRVEPSTGGVAGEAELAALSERFTARAAVVAGENLRARASAVERYAIAYGPLDASEIVELALYDLVVVHPTAGDLDRAQIADLQDGALAGTRDDDVMVLAYVSVGEDLRTSGLTSAQMLADARFIGDGTAAGSGPRVDPRGPDADGEALDGVLDNPLGDLSPLADPETASFATYYLDDNSVDTADGGDYGDGRPDGNPNFGVRFVNAGDPAWFEVLRAMRLDGADGIAGLEELLDPGAGRALVADGVFLDTVDTCAPNAFTDGTSVNQSELEWTAPGMADLIGRIAATWPDQLILQNRGLFFFDPALPHYEFNAGAALDFVLFESYRLDSSPAAAYTEAFFLSNKHATAPRLMAEAGRPDGFRVLSLGYAEGPAWSSEGEPAATLTGENPCATAGERATPRCALLLEDIDEAERVMGFRHYLTGAAIALVNHFVDRQRATDDAEAPLWSSTWNDSGTFPPGAPTPRVGLQEAVVGRAGEQAVARLRWDVALDFGRVGYALYTQSAPFDFDADPELDSAARQVVAPGIAGGYARGPGEGLYPFEVAVDLAEAGPTYFVLRAFDDAVPPNEDDNQVVLAVAAPPDFAVDGDTGEWADWPIALVDPGDDLGGPDGPDFATVRAANDGTTFYLRITSTNGFDPLDGSVFLFIDADFDAATGWTPAGPGFGSDLLVTGGTVYGQTASVFNTGAVGSASVAPDEAGQTDVEVGIPIALLRAVDASVSHVRVVLLNDHVQKDFAPDFGSSLLVPLFVTW